MKSLLIIGAGGHGKVVADIASKNGYDEIIFLDDNEELTECGGYPVIGRNNQYTAYDADVFIAIGNPKARETLFKKVEFSEKKIPTLIHPSASIAGDVSIGNGTVVAAGAVINPGTIIGKGCIINTSSSVDHDCIIKDFVHVSVGAHIAGTVQVGKRTWIGIGATVSNNIRICEDCMIGAGAVVIKNIERQGVYIGMPAKIKNNIKNFGGGILPL